MQELIARTKKYFRFEKQEIIQLLIVTLFTGFIFTFRDWGIESLDAGLGFTHLVLAILLALIALFFRVSVQKITGFAFGFNSTFMLWWAGLIISLVLVFISQGYVPILLPGGIAMAMMVRHRLGEFRYGFNYWEQGIIAYSGSLANILLAVIFKILLSFNPESWFLHKGLFMNIILALTIALPLPKLDGVTGFFSSRLTYFFSYGVLVGISILIFFTTIIWTMLGGLAIGILIWLLFYTMYEGKIG